MDNYPQELNPEEIMITKEITIGGKPVTLAYCYATEISYKLLSDEDINAFMQEVNKCLTAEPQRMPDIRKTIFLVLAATSAYYESRGEELPIDDKTLMYETKPEEMGTALGVVLGLRGQFYAVPSGEPEDKPNGKAAKKRKNA
jgi:hypothetical protein